MRGLGGLMPSWVGWLIISNLFAKVQGTRS